MTTTTRRRTRQTREARREDILTVATELFAAHGYEGTTTAAIARQMGVTQPLIHYHFGSKESLWQEAMDDLFARAHADFGEAAAELASGEPRELVRVLVGRFVKQCAERPEIARIVLHEGMGPSPRFHWLVERHLQPLLGGITALIAHLQGAHLLPDVSPTHLLFIIMGGANQIFLMPTFFEAISGKSPDTDQTIELHTNSLLALLESAYQA